MLFSPLLSAVITGPLQCTAGFPKFMQGEIRHRDKLSGVKSAPWHLMKYISVGLALKYLLTLPSATPVLDSS